MVDVHGYISVPYVGKLNVAGKTLNQIEKKITSSLKGKANYPQVMVKLVKNISSTVTVVGDVKHSGLVPLTPKKERVLDAIAKAGGVKAPINKVTIQMTRAGVTQSMALEKIIKSPSQNIFLQPADILTAYYQSLSFTVLGATGKNTEVNFETQGINLAQALGRMEGLKDNQANASALFIFRFEEHEHISVNKHKKALVKSKIPVIYQVNLNDPRTFFMAQNFPIKDKDVIYVSNAPGTELYKFLRMIGAGLYPIGMTNALYNAT
jgi:polysaccharide export outer membrane protein